MLSYESAKMMTPLKPSCGLGRGSRDAGVRRRRRTDRIAGERLGPGPFLISGGEARADNLDDLLVDAAVRSESRLSDRH